MGIFFPDALFFSYILLHNYEMFVEFSYILGVLFTFEKCFECIRFQNQGFIQGNADRGLELDATHRSIFINAKHHTL